MSGNVNGLGSAVLTSEHLLKILDVCKGPKKVVICKVRICDIFVSIFDFNSVNLIFLNLFCDYNRIFSRPYELPQLPTMLY